MTITDYDFNDGGVISNNVVEKYKGMSKKQINSELDKDKSPMVNVFMNLAHDFNKSSGIRSSNAFRGREVIFVGKRKFDRRGAVGAHHYTTMKHAETFTEVYDYLKAQGYTIFAVDNTPQFNPKPIRDVKFPTKSAFVYGEESLGLPDDVIRMCKDDGGLIYIRQHGSVRSLNVAQAASIVMHEYNEYRHAKDTRGIVKKVLNKVRGNN